MNSHRSSPSRQYRIKIGVLFLVAACVAPRLFGQQFVPPPPLVSTNGSALVRVVPDLADLSFEIEVRNADLTVARKQQAERARKVLAALRAAGVAAADLQSSQLQIAPNYIDRREETAVVKFYSVSQSISCTLHDVKKVSDITAEAVAAGATSVHDICLRTSQLRKFRDDVRAKAIRAAREKAVALAGELGAKVGKPYSITEGADWGSRMLVANNAQVQNDAPGQGFGGDEGAAGDGTIPAFALGTISITASVNVSFLLE